MNKRKKIISVVGARPNFMKLAPIEREFRKHKSLFRHIIVHTGQHYDYRLSKLFFKELDLPEPDIYLGAGSGLHGAQTAKIMAEFEKVVMREKPDLVIVFGDVNSTIACALVCSKVHHKEGTVPVAHVEAGLRSFDNTMPEEVNRIITDVLSEFLFVTEKTGVMNLVKEGIKKNRIFLTGDTMIDSLVLYKNKISRSEVLKTLGLQPGKYILSTIHRPVNVDNKKNFNKIIGIFSRIAELTGKSIDFRIVLPLHPRALKMAEKHGLTGKLRSVPGMMLIEPAGYVDFVKLLSDSKLVITDSGGIQEEATFLRIPCLTLRDSFERPETLGIGTNTLCGLDEELIVKKTREVFSATYKKGRIPGLMDGKASKRIINIIKTSL